MPSNVQLGTANIGTLNPDQLYRDIVDNYGPLQVATHEKVADAGSWFDFIRRNAKEGRITKPAQVGFTNDLEQMVSDPATFPVVKQAMTRAFADLSAAEKEYLRSKDDTTRAIWQRSNISPDRQNQLIANPESANAQEKKWVELIIGNANPINHQGGKFQMSPEVLQSGRKYIGGGDFTRTDAETNMAEVRDRLIVQQREREAPNKTPAEWALPVTTEALDAAKQTFADPEAGVLSKGVSAAGVPLGVVADAAQWGLGGLAQGVYSGLTEGKPGSEAPFDFKQAMLSHRAQPGEQTPAEFAIGQAALLPQYLMSEGVGAMTRGGSASVRTAGQLARAAIDPVGSAGRLASEAFTGAVGQVAGRMSGAEELMANKEGFVPKLNDFFTKLESAEAFQGGRLPPMAIIQDDLKKAAQAAQAAGLQGEKAQAQAWLTSMQKPKWANIVNEVGKEYANALTQSAIVTLTREHDPEAAAFYTVFGGLMSVPGVAAAAARDPSNYFQAVKRQLKEQLGSSADLADELLRGNLRPGDYGPMIQVITRATKEAGEANAAMTPTFAAELKDALSVGRGTPGERARVMHNMPTYAEQPEVGPLTQYGLPPTTLHFPSEASVKSLINDFRQGGKMGSDALSTFIREVNTPRIMEGDQPFGRIRQNEARFGTVTDIERPSPAPTDIPTEAPGATPSGYQSATEMPAGFAEEAARAGIRPAQLGAIVQAMRNGVASDALDAVNIMKKAATAAGVRPDQFDTFMQGLVYRKSGKGLEPDLPTHNLPDVPQSGDLSTTINRGSRQRRQENGPTPIPEGPPEATFPTTIYEIPNRVATAAEKADISRQRVVQGVEAARAAEGEQHLLTNNAVETSALDALVRFDNAFRNLRSKTQRDEAIRKMMDNYAEGREAVAGISKYINEATAAAGHEKLDPKLSALAKSAVQNMAKAGDELATMEARQKAIMEAIRNASKAMNGVKDRMPPQEQQRITRLFRKFAGTLLAPQAAGQMQYDPASEGDTWRYRE